MEKLSGQCLCGELAFELTPPTDFCAHCHCESCRKSHGTLFVTWTSVPEERFHLTKGETLKWFQSSDHIEWGFCQNCGSSVLYRAIKDGHPENPRLKVMYVAAGTLKDMDQDPSCHVSFEEKHRFHTMKDALPKYRGKKGELMTDET